MAETDNSRRYCTWNERTTKDFAGMAPLQATWTTTGCDEDVGQSKRHEKAWIQRIAEEMLSIGQRTRNVVPAS